MPPFHGIRLPGFKEQTLVDRFIYVAHPPPIVTIPLNQHSGSDAVPLVKVGEKVLLGQKIAASNGPGLANVHSSVSGEVIAIGEFPHPFLDVSQAIRIKNDGQEIPARSLTTDRDPMKRSDEELMSIVEEAGLIDMNHEGEPLSEKLSGARKDGVHTLIIDACESEPFLTAFHVLMVARSSEIVRGILLAARLCGAERVIVAIEENKLDALEVLGSKIYSFGVKNIELRKLSVRFPQQAEPVLVSTLLECSIDKARSSLSQGVLVLNMATCFALSESVYSAKPLYERVITVAGQAVAKPRNLLVRIGTDIETVLAECGGFLRPPSRILMGGPMQGTAQVGLSAPVTKKTSAILALAGEEARYPESPGPCIRCGSCSEVCPAELEPAFITLAAEENQFDIAREFHVDLCIECGNCTYICPSHRPMGALLNHAKWGVGRL